MNGPQTAGAADDAERWDLAQPYEESTELVADIGGEKVGAGDIDLDAYTASEVEATEPGVVLHAGATTEAEAGPDLDAGLEAETGPGLETEPEPEPEPVPEPTIQERKLAEVAVLLAGASGCEDTDMPRAAALYQEAIVGSLDASDGAEGLGAVEAELLRGFDGLSSLLERKGLAEEALEVIRDGEALGLLDGADADDAGHRSALQRRREDLRRLLFTDSAQL